MTLLRAFWDAAGDVAPEAAATADEGVVMPWCARGGLARLWRESGVADVRSGALLARASYAGFDDLWSPLPTGVAPSGAFCAALDEDRRAALREALRRRLGVGDGPFELTPRRAWVGGRGRRAGAVPRRRALVLGPTTTGTRDRACRRLARMPARPEEAPMTQAATAGRRITEEVTSWPGVEAGNEAGAASSRSGWAAASSGTSHGDHAAHFSFPEPVWRRLAAEGRIVDHPVFPGRVGPAARRIEDDDDVRDVIALLRLDDERIAALSSARLRSRRRPRAGSSGRHRRRGPLRPPPRGRGRAPPARTGRASSSARAARRCERGRAARPAAISGSRMSTGSGKTIVELCCR